MQVYLCERMPDMNTRIAFSDHEKYCQVCLESTRHPSGTKVLACTHVFHVTCLEEMARNAPYADCSGKACIDCLVCGEKVVLNTLGGRFNRVGGLPKIEVDNSACSTGGHMHRTPFETLEEYAAKHGAMAILMAADDDANFRGHGNFSGGPAYGQFVSHLRNTGELVASEGCSLWLWAQMFDIAQETNGDGGT